MGAQASWVSEAVNENACFAIENATSAKCTIDSSELLGRELPRIIGTSFALRRVLESGRMAAENVSELETLISADASGRRVVLDLKDLRLVDQEVVSFLRRCEAASIELKNCAAYIRKWIMGERR